MRFYDREKEIDKLSIISLHAAASTPGCTGYLKTGGRRSSDGKRHA